jgi:hypothetical protein
MTVFRYYESIKLPPKFDESSITDDYNGMPLEPTVKEFSTFLSRWLKRFGKEFRNKLTLSNLVCHELSFRFKGGPMGPSIITSHLCALAIVSDHNWMKIYMEYYRNIASYEAQRQFDHAISMVSFLGDSDPVTCNKLIIGKISLASEPAGKTRLFAICNF